MKATSNYKKAVVLFLATLISVSALADDLPQSQEPTSEQFNEVIANLPEQISGFSVSPPQEEKISQEVQKELQLQGPVLKLGQKWFASSLQSFVTALVLVGIGEVHTRAHQHNLELTPENVSQLSSEVAADWTLLRQSEYSTTDGALMFIPSQGLNYLANKAVQNSIKSAKFAAALKTLIAGSVLSIGTNYVTDLINVAAEYVLDHSSQFGGLSDKEMAAVKLLHVRSGISYYFHGLIAGGPVTKSAHKKVFKAIQILLFHSPALRQALWSHMTREALLKGNNLTIIGMSVLLTTIQSTLITAEDQKKMGWFEKGYKTYAISIVGSLITSDLIPQWLESLETYLLRMSYADIKNQWTYTNPKAVAAIVATITQQKSDDDANKWISSYLTKRRWDREYRYVMFASLMKLALDQIDALTSEANQVRKMAVEKKPRTVKNVLSSILGGDILPAAMKEKEDGHLLVNFYKAVFWRAAAHATKVYVDAEKEMENDAQAVGGKDQGLFLAEADRMKVLEKFSAYLGQTLSQEWSLTNPPPEVLASRTALDQMSFWSVHESDILRGNKP